MQSEWRFCVVCNRSVRVLSPEGQAEQDLVCLDIGPVCTGGLCPLGAVPLSAVPEAARPDEPRATDAPA